MAKKLNNASRCMAGRRDLYGPALVNVRRVCKRVEETRSATWIGKQSRPPVLFFGSYKRTNKCSFLGMAHKRIVVCNLPKLGAFQIS